MKRRGPNSVANSGRQVVTLRAPKQSILRNRVMHLVRRAIAPIVNKRDVDSQTDVAMIIEGLLWVAAEETAANSRENRLHLREHGTQFYRAMVSLEAQRDHQQLRVDRAVQQVAKVDFQQDGDAQLLYENFKPVLARYLDNLWGAVGDMIRDDDPKGSSLMVCAALMEVSANVAAGAPSEYINKLEDELIHTFKKRLAEKRVRLSLEDAAEAATHAEPDSQDGQL